MRCPLRLEEHVAAAASTIAHPVPEKTAPVAGNWPAAMTVLFATVRAGIDDQMPDVSASDNPGGDSYGSHAALLRFAASSFARLACARAVRQAGQSVHLAWPLRSSSSETSYSRLHWRQVVAMVMVVLS